MNNWIKATLVIPMLMLMTGCWDQIEIEQRGFVVGTALDRADEENIEVTYQIVLPTEMNETNSEKGENPYVNVSSTAKTVFKATRQLASEVSRTPYLSHNQIIIVSDELAGNEHIGEIIDLFIRDSESRRASYIMVSEGKAKDILEVSTSLETLPIQYIISTHNNPDKSEAITPPIKVGNLHRMLLSNTSYALPKVRKVEANKISTAGASVFNGKDHKFVGHLNAEETTGRNMIQGFVKTATLEIEIDEKELVVEILEYFRRIKVKTDHRGLPLFEITVGASASIGESELEEDDTIARINTEIKKKSEDKIKQFMTQVIEVSQKKYETDFLGLLENVYEQQYSLWEKYKDDWDRGEKLYTQCQVNIEVDVRVKTIGTITESR